MKLSLIAMFPLAMVLAACSPKETTPPPVTNTSSSVESLIEAAHLENITHYHWRLRDANNANGARIDGLFIDQGKRLELNFNNQRVSVLGGCNVINGGYQLQDSSLKTGQLISTMMACDEPLMTRDKLFTSFFENPLQVTLQEGDNPQLTLATNNGQKLIFEGVPTAETRYGGISEQVFLEVEPERVSCSHPLMPNHQCLKVREIVYAENGVKTSTGEWQNFYDEIEGFTHQPGTRNILRLKKFTLKNPPADASAFAYVLDMVVSSELVSEQ